jgi:hypothetical protein
MVSGVDERQMRGSSRLLITVSLGAGTVGCTIDDTGGSLMRTRTKVSVLVAGVAALGAVGAAWGTAPGGDDQPLTGTVLEQATEAALAHTDGGTVTETEIGDDGAAYGVEIRLSDGRQVEVNLDSGFEVTGAEADDDGAEDDSDDDSPDDD